MSFDLLARHYGWMETVLAGALLQRCRTTWLDELNGCRELLIAGIGTGRFLSALSPRHPQLRITCVDASERMLAAAARRAGKAGWDPTRLEWVHASLPDWKPPPGRYDAIATHFFLDCFPPAALAEVIAVLTRSARPGARWLVSDFTIPPTGLNRQRARIVHALMYGFFRLTTNLPARRLTPPDPLLQAQGFRLSQRRTYNHGLLHADLWQRRR